MHGRNAKRYERLFKLYCFKAWKTFTSLRATDTFDVVECLERAGLKSKTHFKNVHTKGSPQNVISFSALSNVDKTDLAVFTDK